jgi:Ca2+-binding EF-hand superfamily protein
MADPGQLRGPEPPQATEMTREERRFARFDRNGDRIITRDELLASRTKAFKALDRDGNNLLTFEEWAVATSDRFAKADGDRNGRLSPEEFATTRPKRPPQRCKC